MMRSVASALSAVFVLLLVIAPGNAEARRRATSKERATIAAKVHVPAKCSVVWISTVDRHWATFHFNDAKFEDPECAAVAGDGVVIMRLRKGAWRTVTSGSSFECPVPKTPKKIAKDLRVSCHDAR